MTKENQIEFNNTDLLIELYELLFNDAITVETSKIVSKIIMDLIDNQDINEEKVINHFNLIDNHEIDEEKVINHFNEKNPENIKFDLKEDLETIYDICLEIYEEE